uniref:Uncharacterized protein n=1 Tax=Anguilla anguilla TaxID=7936 RepID=A0A0E9VRA7_ANGAN
MVCGGLDIPQITPAFPDINNLAEPLPFIHRVCFNLPPRLAP